MAFGGFFGGGSSSSSSSSDSSKSNDTSSTVPNPIFSSGGGGSSSSLPTSSSSSGSSADIKSRLQTAITTESNIINAKFLIQKINENCFEHCITDPQASLSSKENTCLSTCMEKYIEAWNTTSKTYVSRLQREGASLGGLVGGAGASGPGGREMF